jgi:hypothetical protein
MNIQLLTVNRIRAKAAPRPRISFKGDWLPGMGFLPGALVQALPVPDGIDFLLCDELHGTYYSELYALTKERGGKLIRVILNTDSRMRSAQFPELVTTGQTVYSGGLSIGDTLVARYEYGVIRARKIDVAPDTRLVPMGTVKENYTKQNIPKIRLSGHWLRDYGFEINSLLTAQAVPGSVTFTLENATPGDYVDLVRRARRQKTRLIQVRTESDRPRIGITGSSVDRAGFALDDILAVSHAPGILKLQRLAL